MQIQEGSFIKYSISLIYISGISCIFKKCKVVSNRKRCQMIDSPENCKIPIKLEYQI